MTTDMQIPPEKQELLARLAATEECLAATKERLAKAEETLSAIRNGEIDGIVLAVPHDDQVHALTGSDHKYQVIIEAMEEGAATLGADGTILFCNRRFATMLRLPHAQILGSSITQFLTAESNTLFTDMKTACRHQGVCNEMLLQAADGTQVPISLACSPLQDGESESLCLVATDMTTRNAADAEIRELNRTLEARVEARTTELRASEERFLLALRNAPVSVAIQDRDLRYTWAYNQRTLRPEEIVGKLDADLFTPEVAAHLQVLKRRVLDENIELREQMWLDRPNGRLFLDVYWEPIHDTDGHVIGIGSATFDLTPIKLAEEATLAAHRQIQNIIDNTPDTVYAFDLEERFVLANSAVAALFNTTPEQMIGKRRDEFMPKEDADWHEANDRKAIEAGKALEFEEYSQFADRSITWLTTKFPLRDAEGRIYAVAGISADITERKQVEAALLQMRFVLSEGQRIAHVGSFEYVVESQETLWSDEECRIYGLEPGTPSPAYAVMLAKHIYPDDAALLNETFSAAMASRGVYELEHRIVRPDGSVRWVYDCAHPHFDTHGNLVRYIGATLDLTERKQVEMALQASLNEKEVLLKEIHHRVKNNMQVIASLVNLQDDSLNDPNLRPLFNDLRDQVRAMALVHEKLYQSDNLAETDFAKYTQSLLNYLWRAHGDATANVRLTLDLQPVSLTVESAVPCGLILNELVTNALKHAFRDRDDGELRIQLHTDPDGHVCLRVSDNGIGLPPDWRQAPSLGLQLVQMLTVQVHGMLNVQSDGGTSFVLRFMPNEAKEE